MRSEHQGKFFDLAVFLHLALEAVEELAIELLWSAGTNN
jgi:hypothetical protein